jgi:hypothetical protein
MRRRHADQRALRLLGQTLFATVLSTKSTFVDRSFNTTIATTDHGDQGKNQRIFCESLTILVTSYMQLRQHNAQVKHQ